MRPVHPEGCTGPRTEVGALIISKQKPFEEILESLRDESNVYIVGCGECATMTQSGGETEAAELMRQLGITPADLVSGAYIDLLKEGGATGGPSY